MLMKKLFVCFLASFILIVMLSGIALSADSPEDVYAKYINAMKTSKWKEMESCLSKSYLSQLQRVDEATRSQIYNRLQAYAPLSYKIIKKEIGTDKATLWVEGRSKSQSTGKEETSKMTVILVKEEGAWKIDQEHTESKQM